MHIVEETPTVQETPEATRPPWPYRFYALAETWGLHPGTACIALGINQVVPTVVAPDGQLITLQLAGLALLPIAYLVQRVRFDKSRRVALVKALGASLSTGAPILGVLLVAALGVMGAVIVRRRRAGEPDVLETQA